MASAVTIAVGGTAGATGVRDPDLFVLQGQQRGGFFAAKSAPAMFAEEQADEHRGKQKTEQNGKRKYGHGQDWLAATLPHQPAFLSAPFGLHYADFALVKICTVNTCGAFRKVCNATPSRKC
jgi:hypothetical protein